MSQDTSKDTRHAPTLDTINSLNSEGDTDALGDWWDAEQYTVDLTKSPTPGAKSLSVFVVLLSIAVSLNKLCLICCNCKNILIWYCCPVTANKAAEEVADEEEEEEEGDLEVEEEEAEDEEEANAQGQQGQVAAKQKEGENQKKRDKKGGRLKLKGKAKIGVAEAGEGEEPQKKKTTAEVKAEQRAKLNAMADEEPRA